MRIKSPLDFIKNQVQKLWPRRIINKIAVTNVLTLFITICGLSWYALIERSSYQVETVVSQYKEYAAQIARVSKNYIESDSIDELEEVVSSFMMMDGRYDIAIKDVGFNTLVALRNSENNFAVNLKEGHKRIAPVVSGQYARVENGVIEVWHQIASENPVGCFCPHQYCICCSKHNRYLLLSLYINTHHCLGVPSVFQ